MSQRDLHTRRLVQAKAEIEEWRSGSEDAHSSGFKAWKDRVLHSLTELFGGRHHYRASFVGLHFWQMRMPRHGQRTHWTSGDQERFVGDLDRAEAILTDALEELPHVPAPPSSATPTAPRPQPVVVQVNNYLQQNVAVDLGSFWRQLDELSLSAAEKTAAADALTAVQDEASGQQRWPVIAGALEQLKALGKTVYEKVAVPLLVEILKKQIGGG